MYETDTPPIREAQEMYLTDRQADVRDETLRSLRSRTNLFCRYLEQETDVSSLSDVSPTTLHRYKVHQSNNDIAARTLVSRLSTVAVWLDWMEGMKYVTDGLADHMRAITPESNKAKQTLLQSERAESILQYLNKYEYGSRDHVVILLLWETGIRSGSLRSLDLPDIEPDETKGCLRLVHREPETPLKNGTSGERYVSLRSETIRTIRDYVEHYRRPQTAVEGREPLLTTRKGRMAIVTIRRTVYRYTRPCSYGESCPLDRDTETCEATDRMDSWSKCPEGVSPHDVRRGALTRMCRSDAPTTAISDRADVSPEILNHHYNQMTDAEKMEQRRNYFR